MTATYDRDARAQASAALAQFLAGASRIVAFTGAGLSTECGVPGLPLARQPLAGQRADRLRVVSGEPGDAGRSVAAKVRHGRPLCRRGPGPRPRGLGPAGPGGPAARHHHAEHRRAAAGGRVARAQARSNCTATAGSRAASSCGSRHDLGPIRARLRSAREHHPDVRAAASSSRPASRSAKPSTPADLQAGHRGGALLRPDAGARAQACWCAPLPDSPMLAKRNGASLLIVNNDPTPLDDAADLVIRDDIGSILQQI